MTPTEGSLKKNEAFVYRKLFPVIQSKVQKSRFQIENHFRITAKRGNFRKGYRPNFTAELFVIDKVQDTDPITYRIKDFQGDDIER